MFRAFGLQTHIRANQLRSLLLIASFLALVVALTWSFLLLYEAAMGGPSVGVLLARATADLPFVLPWSLGGTALWFLIAFAFHRKMIAHATGAEDLAEADAPRLRHVLETLCISRGLVTPRLMIIETPALNAYASGLGDADATVTVTRGLVDALSETELEAVLAHELTHLRNRDTQLLVVAIIFTGLFGFIADLVFRNLNFPLGGLPRSNKEDRESKSSGAAIIVIVIALAIIALSWGLSVLARFALSRTREFMADAGAVDLTKNPDAMISALRKIEGRGTIPDMPSRMSAFFIDNPLASAADLAATHPAIAERVAALVTYAGGVDPGPMAASPAAGATGPWGAQEAKAETGGAGPWGAPPA